MHRGPLAAKVQKHIRGANARLILCEAPASPETFVVRRNSPSDRAQRGRHLQRVRYPIVESYHVLGWRGSCWFDGCERTTSTVDNVRVPAVLLWAILMKLHRVRHVKNLYRITSGAHDR